MTVNLNLSRIAAVVRQLAAIAAVVVGSLNQIDLPTSIRAALVAAGGIILTAEHIVAAIPGTTTPPAVGAAKPVVPPVA